MFRYLYSIIAPSGDKTQNHKIVKCIAEFHIVQKNVQPMWLYNENQFYVSQAFDFYNVKRTIKLDGLGPLTFDLG